MTAAIPPSTREGLVAARELAGEVAGRVDWRPLTRWLYATDASSYRVVPDAVLVAGSVDDLAAAAAVSAAHGVPLVVRGAGSSLAGQAIGPGIVIDCFHLDRILDIDPARRVARVEPGVIQASLNRAAAAYGLEFGPDTSTVDQATIGGMVGNNSSGSRSVVYGETVDKTVRLRTVLADGSAATFGPCRGGELSTGIEGPGGARIVETLSAMRDRSRSRIAEGFPQTRRRVSGYNLKELLLPEPNLARVLVGSEGTLALSTELEVELDPLPASRLMAALSFPGVRRALEANIVILSTGPSAVEVLDMTPLRRAPNLRTYSLLAPLLDTDDQAVLMVEYQGSEDQARAGLARLRAVEAELGASFALYFADVAEVAQAWQLRRAVLPLLMGAPGPLRPAAFVEDTAVAPEKLADFVDDFRRVVAEHGATASFTGHCSAGCMHVRPMLDLKSAQGVASMAAIAHDVGRLVLEYHGVLSGEHGDGYARSWFNPVLFGPELYAEFVALKDAFDPDRRLGPGHVVDGPPLTEHLRFGPSYRARTDWQSRLSWDAEGGFDLAIEKCFGSGQCKKLTGTMCPPAGVTRDESLTTRARANALQAVLSGALPLDSLTGEDLRDVLGTCLACKACKTECPAGVDMAALKAEWLAEVRAREGVPALARAVARLRLLSRLAAPFAPLINLFSDTGLVHKAVARVGVAPQRRLPTIVRRSLTRRFADARAASAERRLPFWRATVLRRTAATADVVLVADCFIEHQEPEIGEAFVALLERAGINVAVVDAGCCGRTMLSTGLIEAARGAASRAARSLLVHARAGRTIAWVEPSCLAMVLDDWRRLLPDEPAVGEVAAASRSATAVVADLAEAGRVRFVGGGAALWHPHCHERAVVGCADTERALRAVPDLDLSVLDEGCCGMSGVYGYEAAHYEMSVAIAERGLLPEVRAAGAEVAVLATGTSCRAQIGDLSPRRAQHPLVFLAGRLL